MKRFTPKFDYLIIGLLQEGASPVTCDVVSTCISAEEVDLSLIEV